MDDVVEKMKEDEENWGEDKGEEEVGGVPEERGKEEALVHGSYFII